MITGVKVNGFRSLLEFEVALKKGLNVVVGPNGAGKTNFVEFLDFCGILLTSGLNLALYHCGGASEVFSKEVLSKATKDIELEISGSFDPKKAGPSQKKESWEVKYPASAYLYKATIRYDSTAGRIFIYKEEVVIVFHDGQTKRIERKTKFEHDECINTIKFIPRTSVIWKDFIQHCGRRFPDDVDFVNVVERWVDEDSSVIDSFSQLTNFFDQITEDVSQLTSANIIPSVAAENGQVSTGTNLARTGEGLANLLYALQENKYIGGGSRRMRQYRPPYGRRIFAQIVAWSSEINPDIANMRVDYVARDLSIEPKIVFESNQKLSYSFKRLSDGTVKWIALTTIMLADAGYNVIEEPENFLHPMMQEKFVQLARTSAENRRGRVILITTHSETLLNECSVDELVVFYSSEGRTVAKKPRNRHEIDNLVRETGFGLGYFYRVGALDVS